MVVDDPNLSTSPVKRIAEQPDEPPPRPVLQEMGRSGTGFDAIGSQPSFMLEVLFSILGLTSNSQ